jgi:hypothetical protein
LGGAIALALLPFVLFWKVALGRTIFGEGDLLAYNYPLLAEIARQWKLGQVPLWYPHIFGGTPLLAQMQGGAFYPFNALLLVLPLRTAFFSTILLHYSLIGVFTFLYLGALRCRRLSALVGGVVFMLGGFAVSHLGHVSTLRTLPWLPVVLFGLERWRRDSDPRGLGIGALGFGFLLLAGHPQIPCYAVLVTVTYGLWFALRGDREGRRRGLAGLVAVVGIGSLIGAVQWVATAAAAGEYSRPLKGDYEYFSSFSFHPVLFANLMFPEMVPCDGSEEAAYLGIAGLALAVLGAVIGRRLAGDHALYFRGLAVVAVVLMLGRHTPLARLLVHVPVFGTFTAPARHLFEFSFSAAVLAAFGLDALLSLSPAQRRKATRWAAGGILVAGAMAVAGAALARAVGVDLPEESAYLVQGPFPWAGVGSHLGWIAASMALLAGIGIPRLQRIALSGLPLLLAFDLSSYTGRLYRQDEPTALGRAPESVAALRDELGSFRTLCLEQPDGLDQALECLAPDYNVFLGVESLNGFDSLILRSVVEASGGGMPSYGMISGAAVYAAPQFQRFMDLLGARFVLVPAHLEADLPPPRYTPAYQNRHVRVYRNEGARPRLRLVNVARRVTSDQALEALASGTIEGEPVDLRRLALVEAPADLDLPHPSAPAENQVRLLHSRAGDLEVATDSPSAGVLVHGTNFAAGWEASVDGDPRPLLRVDGLVQGVLVPPGAHVVRFAYRPVSFRVGAALSLAGLALAALVSRGLLGRAFSSRRPAGLSG